MQVPILRFQAHYVMQYEKWIIKTVNEPNTIQPIPFQIKHFLAAG